MEMVSGTIIGMELKIDKSGRIVVPKALRERFGFKPDSELEALELPEGVLIKKAEERPSMAKVDGLWAHQGIPQAGANWNHLLEEIREERIKSVR
jgi:AbrB family looped-hinge helix DNA binding protein